MSSPVRSSNNLTRAVTHVLSVLRDCHMRTPIGLSRMNSRFARLSVRQGAVGLYAVSSGIWNLFILPLATTPQAFA